MKLNSITLTMFAILASSIASAQNAKMVSKRMKILQLQLLTTKRKVCCLTHHQTTDLVKSTLVFLQIWQVQLFWKWYSSVLR